LLYSDALGGTREMLFLGDGNKIPKFAKIHALHFAVLAGQRQPTWAYRGESERSRPPPFCVVPYPNACKYSGLKNVRFDADNADFRFSQLLKIWLFHRSWSQ
jgi:hypothetical protein